MRMNKDDMEIFFEALDGMPCAKENKCAEKYRELYKLVEDLTEELAEKYKLETEIENLNEVQTEAIEILKDSKEKLEFNIKFMHKEIEFLQNLLLEERSKNMKKDGEE